MKRERVVIIGAGIGGLVASLLLSARGFDVTVIERAMGPGGKMRQVAVEGQSIDAGPTVFTLKHIFEEIFALAGHDFDALVPTTRATTLARHAWSKAEHLDLFADGERSRDAIAEFAGLSEARGFDDFRRDARRIWDTLEHSFIRAPAPDMLGLVRTAGLRGLADLAAIHPFTSLWTHLGRYFRDERLRQLFGRYATYCGSSPYAAPATLMLVAHVEQEGVWTIDGGMYRLALAMADLAAAQGARFLYDTEARDISLAADGVVVTLSNGERLRGDRLVFNGDPAALSSGMLGDDPQAVMGPTTPKSRSLSAVTWTFTARCDGFSPRRHNVFFSRDYRAEFRALQQGQAIREPTVYLCAADHGDHDATTKSSDRYLALVNAPANGDVRKPGREELSHWTKAMLERLRACGVSFDVDPQPEQATTPDLFNAMFPSTGGALYGMASHGWLAAFRRPAARTRSPRMYLAGGAIHPGPGIPMAALSGWRAAQCIMTDSHSPIRSLSMVTAGGMSTRSPMTGPMV